MNRAATSSSAEERARRADVSSAVFLTLVFLAFALRVYDLAGQSFWWDEAYSALLAEKGLRAIFHELRVADFHPPLHYLMTWAWLPLAGRSEFALRFLAVACGTLTVAVGAQLGRRLYGRLGGAISALLFGLSPFLYYYSQEARMYAPAALFATLALYLLHRAIADGRWRLWLAYAAACLLGLYTFYYFVFIPIFGAAWTLLALRDRRKHLMRWLAASALTLIGYAPWLPVLLGRNAVWDSTWATVSSPVKTIGWSWVTLTLGLPTLGLFDQPLVAALLGLLGVLVAVGLIQRLRSALAPYLFSVLAFVLPLTLIAAVAMVKPVYHPRYAVAATPGLLLALAGALAGPLSGKRRSVPVALVGGIVVAVACGYGLWTLNTNPTYFRDDYRGAVAYVESHLGPSDTIIYNVDPGFRYYYHGEAPISFFPGPPYEEEHIANALNSLTQGKKRLWYLRHFEAPTDPEGFVERQLDDHTKKVDERWFGGMRLTLYELPPAPSFAMVAIQPTTADFGGKVKLTGYGLASTSLASGDRLDVTLRWQVVAPDADYGVWAGLVDGDGQVWGRVDHQPRNSTYQLSSRWQPGETVTTRLSLPALVGTPPGGYRLEVGVYRLGNLGGLDLLDSSGVRRGQSFDVTSLQVTPGALGAVGDPALPIQPKAKLADAVELSGAKLESAKTGPGGKLSLTLLWLALAAPSVDYSSALRLVGADGSVLADTKAPVAGGFPSQKWREGELVREQRALAVPTSAPAGKATLQVAILGGDPEGATTWLDLAPVEIDSVQRRFDEPSISHRVDDDFGGSIRLLGYSVDPQSDVRPGSTVKLTLYWKALTDGMPAYRVFTHLLDGQSRIWGQKDGEPVNWTRPTSSWVAQEVIEDTYEIEVQRDAAPGSYDLEVGIYDPSTGERLAVTDSTGAAVGDRLILQSVGVSGTPTK